MCHSTDSRPPGPPNPGEVAECGELKLTSSDGTVFPAYYAIPAESNGASVIILPDIRGAHPFYAALAERFAEAGFHTVAIDYYGRIAGSDHRDDTFDWKQYLPQIKPEDVQLDVKAATDYLRERGAGPVFTVGFCYGGGHSWRLAASDLGLAGVIGFYGLPKLVHDVVNDITTPLLLLVAGDDVATPQEDFQALADQLGEAGATYEIHVYDGAPHSFFDQSYAKWTDACIDAWQRVLDFTVRHAAKQAV
jgi:carboxymethylenebutenolidase